MRRPPGSTLNDTLFPHSALSRSARAVQLPAWNEALGLPRPWDQQWSLRLQQIVAYETDLLDYDDIFNGSTVIAAKVAELKAEATAELARIEAMGGARSEEHKSELQSLMSISYAVFCLKQKH